MAFEMQAAVRVKRLCDDGRSFLAWPEMFSDQFVCSDRQAGEIRKEKEAGAESESESERKEAVVFADENSR